MDDDIEVDSVIEDTSTVEADEVELDQPEAEDDPSESAEDGTTDEVDDEESDAEEDQAEEQSPPETVKVEYDGEEYSLPPKLKDAFMRDQDYTQKTQDLAETRRNHEAEVADFQQYMDATKEHSDHMANLAAIDQQLQSFQAYDWNAAFDADITSATKLQHQFQQLQSQRDQLVGTIQQSEQQRQQQRHEHMARTAERTDATLAKELPNWGDERKTELGKFAVDTLGLPADMVTQAVTAPEIRALHYAEIGYRVANQAKKAAQKPVNKVPEAAPSKNIRPKRQSAPKTLKNVSDPEQYRALRLAQKQRKGA